MFTGLIEELGTIKRINAKGHTLALVIEAQKIMNDLKLGDSIAVNGVCLTVTNFAKTQFEADVMPETFKNTSLSSLKEGSKVNLERAMLANGRFGGHFVTGHIDGTGRIRKRTNMENAILVEIEIPETDAKFVLEKGSIAIDGTSLTIFKTGKDSITVSLIPHTAKEALLGYKSEGEIVNLEFDVMAKYFYSFMNHQQSEEKPKGLTADFLKENGFY
ncbi:riboflavin synthase [Bacillus tuaregi]|uniref:riboflavin synthase n=1 Tax=Bacillus tuaregi TaxID=1816695 RepID=UPI0008F83CD6|nr:riboflavin synthase [Bacillus tuaregi]